jgi:hypothetical protein
MDYVVDIQGFRDAFKQFVIKEVTVLTLHRNHVGHWLAAPPCPFTDLPEDVRVENNYLSRNHHGIEWFDGDIPARQIHAKLREVARGARLIYTRGLEKAKLLQSITSRQITNLEDRNCPSFKKLPPADTYCMYHALQKQGSFVCSLNRATLLKAWLLARPWDGLDVVDKHPSAFSERSTAAATTTSDGQFGAAESFELHTDEDLWCVPG